MTPLSLDMPVTHLPTVRGKASKGLDHLGIRTLRQLLFHFPSRHEDRRTIVPIGAAFVGSPVVLRGVIERISAHSGFRRQGGKTRRLLITDAVIRDESGSMSAVWFHQRFLEKQFLPGMAVYAVGTVTPGDQGPTLVAPELERVHDHTPPLHAERLVPIYPETAGVSSRLLRFLVSRALPLAEELTEYCPEETRRDHALCAIADAVRGMHFPDAPVDLERARTRLAFDELLLLQLAALVRKRARHEESAVQLSPAATVVADAVSTLPFSLTSSQREALRIILEDLRRLVPMNRLLAGDVGSGKTVVAGLAALAVKRSGAQTALVAPTEILAAQHTDALRALFGAAGVRVALLTASVSPEDRERVLRDTASGNVDVLVGTHALFHASLTFPLLALVVVDEQHRFGVEQRAELTTLGAAGHVPHFLSLSATPIPRTLQLTAYGDVDVTLLEPRPGSKPIRTEVVAPGTRNTVYASLANRVRAGGQAFVICPRVAEGEDDTRSVVKEFDRLRRDIFSDFRLGMLHGKLPTAEKLRTLAAFRDHGLDMLVASSVVEVGVDIPNAAALLIEGAERFGLAQLHQFRGRVGRRGQEAVCYLASDLETEDALDRLKILERTQNGLEIAEADLERRGGGEMYGTRQSGGVRLKVASITDVPFLLKVRGAAEELLQRDPLLHTAPLLARRIKQLNVTTHFE